jgi:NAD(P)-dependent dehydrogenase (short-subunit alcohol dehydrogenase family)
MIQKTALKRIAQPEEVTKVIGFLLSEEAGYITASVRSSILISLCSLR